jgi:carbon monoxide dehydrogenase subunit G
LAEAVEWVAVAATPETILALIRDRSQRARFLPDGWRVLRLLTTETETLGAAMEIEADIGPGTVVQVVQLLETGDDFVTEGPPGGDNFMTTWTVQGRGDDTIVQEEVEFHYGGLIGEFFARRKLRRAMRQQLQRLKSIAEAG